MSVRTKKLTNRGFMRGPFIPIYGCGCVLMTAVGMPLMEHPVEMFFVGMVCASVMEYVTGDMMLRLFRVRYWDYSKAFLNIKGHVCLAASLLWGVFTLLINYVARAPIEKHVLMIPYDSLHFLVLVLLIYFVADFSLSFKTALDLRDVIIAMENIRQEIERMEKRMDVVIAFADDAKNQAIDAWNERIEESTSQVRYQLEERMNNMEKQLDAAKEHLAGMDIRQKLGNIYAEALENHEIKKQEIEARYEEAAAGMAAKKQEFMEQISEYKLKNELMRTKLKESAERRGALYRNMIRNNILYSDRFMDSLEEIKQKVDEFTQNKKGSGRK